jgi:hypothetical protein
MDAEYERLEALDTVINMDITVDDLRRILMLFRYVKYRMEYDDENHLDLHDEVLMRWFEHLYTESLRTEGINCF